MGLAARLKAANPTGGSLAAAPPTTAPPPATAGYPAPSAPAPGVHPDQFNIIHRHLTTLVKSNQLDIFYPPHRIQEIAGRLAKVDFTRISSAWRIPLEIAFDLAALALYDVVFYCDDSGSMSGAENGTRIDDMKVILERVAEVATVFDDDGISVRFMNANVNGDHITAAYQITQLLQGIPFKYTTPLGTELKKKIIDPFGLQKLRNGALGKPVLVIIITDGEPYPEPRNVVYKVIGDAKAELVKSGYPVKAITYQFAQCGRDEKAQEFLSELDSNQTIGDVIDAVSYYELECSEFAKKGVDLTPELYLVKLCVGAIDPSYDSQDETKVHTGPPMGGYAPPPGGYAPPAGGYAPPPGPPPGGYAPPRGPPPGGYAPPPGPPPGGYAPPPGPPPGGYAPPPGGYAPPPGAPPPGAGYPQYGAPPPGQYRPPRG
ncbi:hypothetical protein HDU96_010404 [Phlyctochytrium bullatum]|nr:hypothetical protein HDU96_010404 [Phlyctochytrium bullatum]